MALLAFKVEAQYEEAMRLREEIDKLEKDLNKASFGSDKWKALNSALFDAKNQLYHLASEATKSGNAIQHAFQKKDNELVKQINEISAALAKERAEMERLSKESDRLSSLAKDSRKRGDKQSASMYTSQMKNIESQMAAQGNKVDSMIERLTTFQFERIKNAKENGLVKYCKEAERASREAFGAMSGYLANATKEGSEVVSIIEKIASTAAGVSIGNLMYGGISNGFNMLQGMAEKAVQVRSSMQDIESNMAVFLKSKDAAKSFTNDLSAAAYYNMNEFSDLVSASKQMLAYGHDVKNIIPTIQKLSEIQVGTGGNLHQIVDMYNRAKSIGYVDSRTQQSWASQGIILQDELQKLGDTSGGSKITFDQLNKVIDSMTGEGGMFHGVQAEMMTNISAEQGQMEDQLHTMYNEMGELFADMQVESYRLRGTMAENWRDIADAIGIAVVSLGSYRAALVACKVAHEMFEGGELTESIKTWADSINEMTESVKDNTEGFWKDWERLTAKADTSPELIKIDEKSLAKEELNKLSWQLDNAKTKTQELSEESNKLKNAWTVTGKAEDKTAWLERLDQWSDAAQREEELAQKLKFAQDTLWNMGDTSGIELEISKGNGETLIAELTSQLEQARQKTQDLTFEQDKLFDLWQKTGQATDENAYLDALNQVQDAKEEEANLEKKLAAAQELQAAAQTAQTGTTNANTSATTTNAAAKGAQGKATQGATSATGVNSTAEGVNTAVTNANTGATATNAVTHNVLTVSVNAAAASFLRLTAAVLTCPYTWIALAVAAVGVAVYKLATAESEQARAERELAEAREENKRAMEEEESRIEALVKASDKETASTWDRTAALQELSEEYERLANLGDMPGFKKREAWDEEVTDEEGNKTTVHHEAGLYNEAGQSIIEYLNNAKPQEIQADLDEARAKEQTERLLLAADIASKFRQVEGNARIDQTTGERNVMSKESALMIYEKFLNAAYTKGMADEKLAAVQSFGGQVDVAQILANMQAYDAENRAIAAATREQQERDAIGKMTYSEKESFYGQKLEDSQRQTAQALSLLEKAVYNPMGANVMSVGNFKAEDTVTMSRDDARTRMETFFEKAQEAATNLQKAQANGDKVLEARYQSEYERAAVQAGQYQAIFNYLKENVDRGADYEATFTMKDVADANVNNSTFFNPNDKEEYNKILEGFFDLFFQNLQRLSTEYKSRFEGAQKKNNLGYNVQTFQSDAKKDYNKLRFIINQLQSGNLDLDKSKQAELQRLTKGIVLKSSQMSILETLNKMQEQSAQGKSIDKTWYQEVLTKLQTEQGNKQNEYKSNGGNDIDDSKWLAAKEQRKATDKKIDEESIKLIEKQNELELAEMQDGAEKKLKQREVEHAKLLQQAEKQYKDQLEQAEQQAKSLYLKNNPSNTAADFEHSKESILASSKEYQQLATIAKDFYDTQVKLANIKYDNITDLLDKYASAYDKEKKRMDETVADYKVMMERFMELQNKSANAAKDLAANTEIKATLLFEGDAEQGVEGVKSQVESLVKSNGIDAALQQLGLWNEAGIQAAEGNKERLDVIALAYEKGQQYAKDYYQTILAGGVQSLDQYADNAQGMEDLKHKVEEIVKYKGIDAAIQQINAWQAAGLSVIKDDVQQAELANKVFSELDSHAKDFATQLQNGQEGVKRSVENKTKVVNKTEIVSTVTKSGEDAEKEVASIDTTDKNVSRTIHVDVNETTDVKETDVDGKVEEVVESIDTKDVNLTKNVITTIKSETKEEKEEPKETDTKKEVRQEKSVENKTDITDTKTTTLTETTDIEKDSHVSENTTNDKTVTTNVHYENEVVGERPDDIIDEANKPIDTSDVSHTKKVRTVVQRTTEVQGEDANKIVDGEVASIDDTDVVIERSVTTKVGTHTEKEGSDANKDVDDLVADIDKKDIDVNRTISSKTKVETDINGEDGLKQAASVRKEAAQLDDTDINKDTRISTHVEIDAEVVSDNTEETEKVINDSEIKSKKTDVSIETDISVDTRMTTNMTDGVFSALNSAIANADTLKETVSELVQTNGLDDTIVLLKEWSVIAKRSADGNEEQVAAVANAYKQGIAFAEEYYKRMALLSSNQDEQQGKDTIEPKTDSTTIVEKKVTTNIDKEVRVSGDDADAMMKEVVSESKDKDVNVIRTVHTDIIKTTAVTEESDEADAAKKDNTEDIQHEVRVRTVVKSDSKDLETAIEDIKMAQSILKDMSSSDTTVEIGSIDTAKVDYVKAVAEKMQRYAAGSKDAVTDLQSVIASIVTNMGLDAAIEQINRWQSVSALVAKDNAEQTEAVNSAFSKGVAYAKEYYAQLQEVAQTDAKDISADLSISTEVSHVGGDAEKAVTEIQSLIDKIEREDNAVSMKVTLDMSEAGYAKEVTEMLQQYAHGIDEADTLQSKIGEIAKNEGVEAALKQLRSWRTIGILSADNNTDQIAAANEAYRKGVEFVKEYYTQLKKGQDSVKDTKSEVVNTSTIKDNKNKVINETTAKEVITNERTIDKTETVVDKTETYNKEVNDNLSVKHNVTEEGEDPNAVIDGIVADIDKNDVILQKTIRTIISGVVEHKGKSAEEIEAEVQSAQDVIAKIEKEDTTISIGTAVDTSNFGYAKMVTDMLRQYVQGEEEASKLQDKISEIAKNEGIEAAVKQLNRWRAVTIMASDGNEESVNLANEAFRKGAEYIKEYYAQWQEGAANVSSSKIEKKTVVDNISEKNDVEKTVQRKESQKEELEVTDRRVENNTVIKSTVTREGEGTDIPQDSEEKRSVTVDVNMDAKVDTSDAKRDIENAAEQLEGIVPQTISIKTSFNFEALDKTKGVVKAPTMTDAEIEEMQQLKAKQVKAKQYKQPDLTDNEQSRLDSLSAKFNKMPLDQQQQKLLEQLQRTLQDMPSQLLGSVYKTYQDAESKTVASIKEIDGHIATLNDKLKIAEMQVKSYQQQYDEALQSGDTVMQQIAKSGIDTWTGMQEDILYVQIAADNKRNELRNKSMNEYIKQYGTMAQKVALIEEEYQAKIAEERDEWRKRQLEQEKNKKIEEVYDKDAKDKHVGYNQRKESLTKSYEAKKKASESLIKDYEDKIANSTDEKEKERNIGLRQQAQREAMTDQNTYQADLISLSLEEMKDSPDYFQAMTDASNATTEGLKMTKNALAELLKLGSELDPKQYEALTTAYNKVSDEYASRNPFRGWLEAGNEKVAAQKNLDDALAEQFEAEAELESSTAFQKERQEGETDKEYKKRVDDSRTYYKDRTSKAKEEYDKVKDSGDQEAINEAKTKWDIAQKDEEYVNSFADAEIEQVDAQQRHEKAKADLEEKQRIFDQASQKDNAQTNLATAQEREVLSQQKVEEAQLKRDSLFAQDSTATEEEKQQAQQELDAAQLEHDEDVQAVSQAQEELNTVEEGSDEATIDKAAAEEALRLAREEELASMQSLTEAENNLKNIRENAQGTQAQIDASTKLQQSNQKVKQAQDGVNKANEKSKRSSQQLGSQFSKLGGSITSVGDEISKVDEGTGKFIKGVGQLVSNIGSGITAVSAAATAQCKSMESACAWLMIIAAAIQATMWILDAVGIFEEDDSFSGAKDQYDELVKVWDMLIDRKKKYLEESWGEEALQTGEEIQKLYQQKSSASQQLARDYWNSGGGSSDHSNGYNQNNTLRQYFGRWSQVTGAVINDVTDLANLSAEQLKKMQEDNAYAWTQIDADARDALQGVIDAADGAADAMDNLKEHMLGISFQSLRDDFVSNMMDMSYSMADFSADINKMMMQALLNNAIGTKLQQKLKEWYDAFYKAMDAGGGQISEMQMKSLKEKYKKLGQEAIKIRDEIAEATGYEDTTDTSTGSASSGIAANVSQDSIDEMTGRLTSVQMITQGIAQTNEAIGHSIISLNQSMLDAMLREEALQTSRFEGIAQQIAETYLEIQAIHEDTTAMRGAVVKMGTLMTDWDDKIKTL